MVECGIVVASGSIGKERAIAKYKTPEIPQGFRLRGAGGGIRTRDLLFTRQLLCQLSYAGAPLL